MPLFLEEKQDKLTQERPFVASFFEITSMFELSYGFRSFDLSLWLLFILSINISVVEVLICLFATMGWAYELFY